MEAFQQLAWSCLTKKEQNCLYYHISHGKSSWEMGKMMNITHYKVLELKNRAETLFRMFSDYFEKHPSLIRPGCPVPIRFRDYLYALMMRRLPKEEALYFVDDSTWFMVPVRNKQISTGMTRLKYSEDAWDQDLYKLVVEFDRWNSFRVLPRELQKESPYTRRSNRKVKNIYHYLHKLPPSKYQALKMAYKVSASMKDVLHSVILDKETVLGYEVIRIANTEDNIKQFSKMNIFLFSTREEAVAFGGLLVDYFTLYKKEESQKRRTRCWKDLDPIARKAVNYSILLRNPEV